VQVFAAAQIRVYGPPGDPIFPDQTVIFLIGKLGHTKLNAWFANEENDGLIGKDQFPRGAVYPNLCSGIVANTYVMQVTVVS
jgi:hypothetical protein